MSQQPQRSERDDAEFRRNYMVAEYINALYALDNNWVGQGVLVGVMDDGVHPVGDLSGQVDTRLSRDFGHISRNGVLTYRSGDDRIGDITSTHGTPVAGIIAARDDGQNTQGLAPGATIVSLRIDGVIDGQKVWGIGRDKAIRYAADTRIPLVNMSLALRPGTAPSQQFMDAIAYYNRRTRGLVIASAGNNGLPTSASSVEVDPAFAESWLFVAALKSDGRDFEMADYSNRCGSLMSRCVVAPTLSRTVGADGQEITFGGTSSAAPVVTAVAAMILSKWPQLTGVDAGNIILNSARDLGEPGTDAVYGRGLVDAKAALRPANPSLSNGKTQISLSNANMLITNSAFGGITQTTLQDVMDEVTVLDQYGRDFTGSLAGMVIQPASVDDLAMNRRVEAQMNAHNAGFIGSAGSAVIGVAAFDTGLRDAFGVPVLENQLTNADVAIQLDNKVSLIGGFNSNNNILTDILGLAPTSDAMFAYSPLAQASVGIRRKVGSGQITLSGYRGSQEDLQVNGATLQFQRSGASLKLGIIDEVGSVFGTPVGQGMLRFGDGARTYFAEAASSFDLGKWRFGGFASIGGTRLRLAEDMLLTDADLITTGRFGLIASRSALHGRLSVGVAQQLVVLDGDATFTVANGYSLDARKLLFQDRQVNLQGEIIPQFTVGYQRSGARSSLQLGASSDARGHDVRAVASWKLTFGG